VRKPAACIDRLNIVKEHFNSDLLNEGLNVHSIEILRQETSPRDTHFFKCSARKHFSSLKLNFYNYQVTKRSLLFKPKPLLFRVCIS